VPSPCADCAVDYTSSNCSNNYANRCTKDRLRDSTCHSSDGYSFHAAFYRPISDIGTRGASAQIGFGRRLDLLPRYRYRCTRLRNRSTARYELLSFTWGYSLPL
jgi:hypothetical protein